MCSGGTLFIFLALAFCSSGVLPAGEKDVYRAHSYLAKFGYGDPSDYRSQSLVTEASMEDNIKEFQRFAGLEQTGVLDDETLEMMKLPRCGVKDKIGKGSHARKKRYALQGSRWRVKEILYKFTGDTNNSGLTKDQAMESIKKAFEVWGDVTDLVFREPYNDSEHIHIELSFEKGEHGDGDPFDGVGGTLAHAFFPIYGGDIHIDEKEVWSYSSYAGTNFFQVILHEIGHSLGLSHSDVQASTMAPFYRGYQPNPKLHSDDIAAIQSLYGENKKDRSNTTPKPENDKNGPTDTEKPKFESVLCDDPKIDAIARVADEMDCIFKGDSYWKILEVGLAAGYPRKIADDFEGVPNNVDAVLSSHKTTFFFKGSQYWKFVGTKLDESSPRKISEGFKGIPDNIDAAFIWTGNNKAYFFKGHQYWKYDPESNPAVPEKYPRDISIWGLPNNIDGAFQYNGRTYFFKDTNYWRFNDLKFKISRSNKNPYPRSITKWWYACSK